MRAILKQIDWFYGAGLTGSLVTAYWVCGTVTREVPGIPSWYSQMASVGMALALFAVLLTFRFLVEAGYRIVKNARAA